tara:strand:+ start:662 stop:964 length:303 start_codon:yes stop_codon:yes gene_type:complete
MKRKRSDEVQEVNPHKRDQFYNKDELLTWATSLQLEFNRQFNINYSDLSILRYVQEQTQLETIAKINIIMQACITEKVYKSVEEMKLIINSTNTRNINTS